MEAETWDSIIGLKKSRDPANKTSYLPENKYHITPYRTQRN